MSSTDMNPGDVSSDVIVCMPLHNNIDMACNKSVGDVLIHCGDFTKSRNVLKPAEYEDFAR